MTDKYTLDEIKHAATCLQTSNPECSKIECDDRQKRLCHLLVNIKHGV
jgi:hypothetical protein